MQVVRRLFGLVAASLMLGLADSAWAECTYTTTDVADKDEYSSTWSGTQINSDCFTGNTSSQFWNTDEYTSEETSVSFYDPPSFGTKETSDASGVYTFHYEVPGFIKQDFVRTWNSHYDSLSVHEEQGTGGKAGWGITDTFSSNKDNTYETVGSYNIYGGLLSRDYVQNGTSYNQEASRDHASYDGANTFEGSTSRSQFQSVGSESGSGQDFGNAYTYSTSFNQQSVSAGYSRTSRDGLFGAIISKTEEFFSRASQNGTNNTAYANGSTFESSWSNTTIAGNRSLFSDGDTLDAQGSDFTQTSFSRNTGAGYDTSSAYAARTLSSNWSQNRGGVQTSGSDYYNNTRSSIDNNFGGNRTVQDNGSVSANRSGSAGANSYNSWYSKAWTFVNGLLISSSERSGSGGDASLAAFYANFDASVCEQFKDVANAQNADYSYWGLCLDTIEPGYTAEPAEEPQECSGKAVGQAKNSKGQEKGKGEGLTKERCEDPSDSGKGKKK